MKVHELIAKLQEMPQNAEVIILKNFLGDMGAPEPEQVWDDERENYSVIL